MARHVTEGCEGGAKTGNNFEVYISNITAYSESPQKQEVSRGGRFLVSVRIILELIF